MSTYFTLLQTLCSPTLIVSVETFARDYALQLLSTTVLVPNAEICTDQFRLSAGFTKMSPYTLRYRPMSPSKRQPP